MRFNVLFSSSKKSFERDSIGFDFFVRINILRVKFKQICYSIFIIEQKEILQKANFKEQLSSQKMIMQLSQMVEIRNQIRYRIVFRNKELCI